MSNLNRKERLGFLIIVIAVFAFLALVTVLEANP